ncbi:MAG: hypothetical protein M3Y87_09320 [Myxococcota bacterium]|nr:hypothetical protein [Myxococcota bacterium]
MGERRRGALAAAVLLTIALALSAPARAHVGHVISRAERYLKLDATERDTRVVVSLMLGADEGERVLAAADADGDREVTRSEADAYLAQWGEGLRDELPITIDGERVALTWTDGWLDPIGRVRPIGLTIEMVAHLPVEAREHAIVLEDRMVRREIFDRTDVAFRAHDGAELVACGATPDPAGCETPDLAFAGDGAQPSTYGARVRYPGRADRAHGWWIAIIALLAALIAAGVLLARRHRSD